MLKLSTSKMATGVMAPMLLLGFADVAMAQLACPADGNSARTATTTQLSPYRTGSPYRGALDKVNVLQFPETSECLSLAEIKAGQILRNQFYMTSSNRLVFNFSSTSKGKRLELRGRGFSRTTKNAKMDFTYTIPNSAGPGRSPGFTIGQILTEKVGSASAFPVMRLEVIDERRADGQVYTNFLFAILKTADSAGSKYLPLGPVADAGKFGTVSVTYGNSSNQLFISHTNNGVTRTASLPNVSTNPDFAPGLYFKNGCYLQDAGTCQVTFGSLSYTNVP
jgi:hypothetical protein